MPRTPSILRDRPLVVVGGIAAVVTAAGLARRQPLSWDEAVTAAVATRPVGSILGTLHHSDAVLGVYYLLMHGWSSWLTTVGVRMTETWWRLPSALAVIATSVVVAAVARRQAGPRAGVVAGVCFALLPLIAFYATDARPYALAALVVTTAWWVRTGGNSLRHATIMVVLLIVAAWLQLFTVLVWPAFLIVARGRRRATFGALAVAAAGVVPVGLIALGQSAEIGWIPSASPTNTASVGLHVVGGIGVALAVVALVALAVGSGQVSRSATTAAYAWWIGAPFVVLAALDVVRPVLVARYALVSLPLAAVAVGVLTARVRGRGTVLLRAAGVATVVAAMVTTGIQLARPWKYEDYRAAAAFARTESGTGTAVLFTPSSTRLGFEAYAGGRSWRDLALPRGVGADPLAITELPPTTVRRLAARECSVLVVGDPLTGRSWSAVAGWPVLAARSFGQVTVSVVGNPHCRAAATGA